MKKFIPWLIFLVSAGIFSALFYLQRHFMTNFDENDHLAVAYFMSQGRLLYRDIFSHHFPFPYYWTNIFTPFWNFNNPSQLISIFRLSALALYLVNFLLVFVTFKNIKSQLAYSFWIFCLSTFFTLYHGNLVLSETYAAIFFSSVFWLSLPILLKWEKPSLLNQLFLIFLSSLAFWTQPLLIILFLIPLILYIKNLRITFYGLLITNLSALLFFFFSGQLSAFWQQGIWFNFFIYPKFFVDDQSYWSFFSHELYLFTHFFNPLQISQFILHLSFILLLLSFIKKKNKLHLFIFLTLFVASRIREVKIIPGIPYNFGIYPFLLLGLGCLCIQFIKSFPARLSALALGGSLLVFISSSIISSIPVLQNSLKSGYNYEVFWGYRQRTANLIAKLTSPDEPILVYPHDVDYYTLSQRLPPDRFVYWFPWINAVPEYRQSRLSTLSNIDVPLIYLGNLAFKSEPNFYAQYFPDLLKNYTQVTIDGKTTPLWLKNSHLSRLKSL